MQQKVWIKITYNNFQALKFVQMIQLSSVRRLVDVLDVEECDEDGEVGNYEQSQAIIWLLELCWNSNLSCVGTYISVVNSRLRAVLWPLSAG